MARTGSVPPDITLVALPSKCPELNPVENVWRLMRNNWLSNHIFTSLQRSPRPVLRSLE
jgi:transposase